MFGTLAPRNTMTKYCAAPVATALLLTTGTGLLAPQLLATAVAQGTSTAPTGTAASIDTSRPVSLTIDKRVNTSPVGAAATGETMSPVNGANLNGVTFTATRLDTSNMNSSFAQLTPDEVAALTAEEYLSYGAVKTTETYSGTTSGNTALVLSGMPQAVYLVEESVPSTGMLTDSNGVSYPASSVTPSPAFIVSLPMRNAANTAWNYNVVVYPKNSSYSSVKTVNDESTQGGQSLSYELATQIPPLNDPNANYSKFLFTDQLDTNALDPNSLNVDQVAIVDENGAAIEVLAPADYTVGVSPSGEVTVALTASGLAKVKAVDLVAHPRAAVQVTMSVNYRPWISVTYAAVKNKFTSTVNSGGADTTSESNEVESRWANLRIVKYTGDDSANIDDRLGGAQFQIVSCQDGDGDNTWDQVGNDPISVNGQNSWTTDTYGQINISGLHVEDFANNTVRSDYHYCLKETQAPDGYVLRESLIPFSAKSTDDTTSGSPDQIDLVAEVQNTPKSTPSLPLTGGKGIALLVAVGAALLAAATWMARRNSNKA